MLEVLVTAIALSMDAFSVSLGCGTLGLRKKMILLLAIVVAIFHFFMPLLGYLIGYVVLERIMFLQKYLVPFIFIGIGTHMIFHHDEDDKFYLYSHVGILLFALTVSLDSFTIGIAFAGEYLDIFKAFFIFAIFSGAFTLSGFLIGRYSGKTFEVIAPKIGGLLLLILGLIKLF